MRSINSGREQRGQGNSADQRRVNMKKLLVGGLVALTAVAMIVTVALAHNNGRGKSLKAHLDGYQEVPLAISTTGRGDFKAKVKGQSIEFRLRYSDLSSPVKFAHIHFGREGVAGGVIAFLCGGGGKPACPNSGEVTGTIVPADVIGPGEPGPTDQGIDPGEFDEVVRALKADAVYANVHTDMFGAGEIRGQVDHGHHRGDRKGHEKD
jgi:hypothetical protein